MKKYLFLIVITLFLLAINNVYAYQEYKIGDSISYNNELYFVIENSNSDTEYITLLKNKPLTIQELYRYGRNGNGKLFINEYAPNLDDPEKLVSELTNEIGGIAYYTSSQCGYNYEWNVSSYMMIDANFNGCNNKYELSDVKKVVDNWSNSFKDDLISIDGYEARIPKFEEIQDNLGYKYKILTGSVIHDEEIKYGWVYNVAYQYWTMTPYNDSNTFLMSVPYENHVSYLQKYAIRPVINLKKIALEKKDNELNEIDNIDNSYSPYKKYSIGDEITYNNELYYVIDNSESNDNYITILKDKPLTIEELNTYGKDNLGDMFINKYFENETDNQVYEFSDGIGGIAYITRKSCGDKYHLSQYTTSTPAGERYEISYCTTEYDASNVSKVINKWAFNFDKDLVKVNGYKASLIDYNLLDNILSYDWSKSEKYSYWTRISLTKTNMYAISNDGIKNSSIFKKNAVRPVINLNKCAVELDNPNCKNEVLAKNCQTEKTKYYKEYKFGETINYRGDNYYVLENSGNDKNYVTLLKSNSLTLSDLPNYKDAILNNMKLSNNLGYITYSCDNDVCSTNYDSSNIKKVIDNWMKISLNEDELVSINGYKARIISREDLIENLGYEEGDTGSGISVNKTSSTPSIFPRIGIWTMYAYSDSGLMYIYGDSVNTARELSDYKTIMPVINVKKEIINLDEYPLGQEITYNNDQYYIISYDSPDKNYVTLLRSKPFTQGEITMYSTDNSVFSSPYYISDTCNSGTNISGCSSDFKNSEVKKILDTWSSEFNNDLVEVEGYKIRIPSKYDFIYNLSYDMDNFHATSYIYCKSNDTPSWVNNGYPYWSMEIYEDSNYLVHQNMSNGCLEVYKMPYGIQENSFQSSSIRPVINLNKCAIGGCYETEKCSESETIVEVAKTLKNIPKIILVICGLLVITGSAFIIYNYLKSKKERK